MHVDDDQHVTIAHTRRVTPRVELLYHYPVKGLAGVELTEAHLPAGGGLPYDRAVAISNGSTPVPDHASWVDPSALLGLARNPGLTRLSLDVADAPGTPLTVSAPDGSFLRLHLDDDSHRAEELGAATTQVQGWIPPGTACPPVVVMPGSPLWEQADAAVSLVNLGTVDLLSKTWGTSLDPRRFRANVYVGGMDPWAELDLVGRRVRIGGAELEIVRPMECCRGAAVDPDDGSTALDVPELLAADAGHRFLGLHARVVSPGRIRRGDVVAAEVSRPTRSAAPPVSPPRADWPRPVTVESFEQETETVVHLWTRDPWDLAAAVHPEQHVRLHAVDAAGPFWRSYTVSAVDSGRLRISVALEAGGRMSSYLSERRPEELRLLLTGPYGDVTVDLEDRTPMLLISAGIGITPTVAMLRELRSRCSDRPVSVLHVARRADAALWAETTAQVAALPGDRNRVRLHLSREEPDRCRELGAAPGRPRAEDVVRAVAELPGAEVVVMLCGPDRFGADVRAALHAAGVPDSAIRQEVFYSPPGVRPYTPPVSAGPFAVHFTSSGRRATWTSSSGTLMDLAESCGLSPLVDCREAACNICATAVTQGSTAYVTPPMGPPADGSVLICCAVPTSDVAVEL